jgi:flagellar basal body-associated protein FliL
MSESQWLDHHGRRKNYLWLVIIMAAVCIAAGIFVRNNSEVLGVSGKRSKEPPAAVQDTQKAMPAPSTAAAAAPAEPRKDVSEDVSPAKATAVKPPDPREIRRENVPVPAQKVSAGTVNESVPLERIACRLMDKSQPSIVLSLLLSFPVNPALKQEILVKRDNLKIMVKKTLATKSLDDMVVDSLRRDLKSGLNSVLENGEIADIEFKEFRIEKVE